MIAFILVGCANNTNQSPRLVDYMDIRTEYLNDYYSQYSSLRGQAIDSIQSYIDDSLRYVAFLIHYPPWQLDSFFIFNSDSTRF